MQSNQDKTKGRVLSIHHQDTRHERTPQKARSVAHSPLYLTNPPSLAGATHAVLSSLRTTNTAHKRAARPSTKG